MDFMVGVKFPQNKDLLGKNLSQAGSVFPLLSSPVDAESELPRQRGVGGEWQAAMVFFHWSPGGISSLLCEVHSPVAVRQGHRL